MSQSIKTISASKPQATAKQQRRVIKKLTAKAAEEMARIAQTAERLPLPGDDDDGHELAWRTHAMTHYDNPTNEYLLREEEEGQ